MVNNGDFPRQIAIRSNVAPHPTAKPSDGYTMKTWTIPKELLTSLNKLHTSKNAFNHAIPRKQYFPHLQSGK